MNRSSEAEPESRKMKIITVVDWKDGFETVQKNTENVLLY